MQQPLPQLTRGQRLKLSQFGLPKQFKCQIAVQASVAPTVFAFVTDQNQKIKDASHIVYRQQSHVAVQHIQALGGHEFLVDLEQLQADEQIVFVAIFQKPQSFHEISLTLNTQVEFKLTQAEYALEQSLILGVLYEKDGEKRFHAYGNGYTHIAGLVEHFGFDFRSLLEPQKLGNQPATNSNTLSQPLQLPQLWSGKQTMPSIPGGLTHAIQYIATEQDGNHASSGSGFAISPGGYLLTCYHVIEGAARISVTTENSNHVRNAIVVATDEHHDLALLWLDDQQGFSDWLLLDLEREPQLGDELGLLAYPLGTTFGRSVSYSQGIINGIRQQSDTPFLQIDTGAAPGSSGGAIFSRNSGKVVGILHGGLPMAHGMIINLGIDIRNLKTLGWVA